VSLDAEVRVVDGATAIGSSSNGGFEALSEAFSAWVKSKKSVV
jgi:hypothetical protein